MFNSNSIARTISEERSIPVLCLDIEGKFLGEYDSINQASRQNRISHQAVQRCLVGQTLLCYKKFYFIYKEYYDPNKNYSLKYRKFKKKCNAGQINKWTNRVS